MRRTLDAPGTFDEDGWLRIGLCGHQPGVGENYISTGSLYLCATVFLPLGLPPEDPFWRDPDEPWTAARAWSGRPFRSTTRWPSDPRRSDATSLDADGGAQRAQPLDEPRVAPLDRLRCRGHGLASSTDVVIDIVRIVVT